MTTPEGPEQRVVLRPERGVLFAAGIFLLCGVPLAASAPPLSALLLLPLACLVWGLRARVVGDAGGITVCDGARTRRFGWDRVAGLDLPRRGAPVLVLTDGARVPLRAATRAGVRRVVALAPPGPVA